MRLCTFATAWFFAMGSITLAQQAQAPAAQVSLDRSKVELGQSARLFVTVEAQQVQMALPEVSNLIITRLGQSQQQISGYSFNGGTYTSVRTTFTYGLTPYKEGNFTIPSFAIYADGTAITTTPLQFTVTAGRAPGTMPAQTPQVVIPQPTPNQILGLPGNPSPATAPQPAPRPQPVQPPPKTARVPTVNPDNSPIFMRLLTPRTEFYVGEAIPVTVKLWVLSRISPKALQEHPQIEPANAFSAGAMSDTPPGEPEIVDGQSFHTYSWNTTLTPVKAGEYQVRATMPLRVPVQRGRRVSMFDNFFGGTYEDHPFVAGPVTWKVLDLPAEGRPDHFSGAIGHFQVTASVSPSRVEVGEPITLRMAVSGEGNFDRVTAPQFIDSDGWKIYPPTSEMRTDPNYPLRGEKLFTLSAIPRDAQVGGLPKIEFSFFNPETGKYVTRAVAPPVVSIANTAGKAVPPAPPEAATAAPSASPDAKSVASSERQDLSEGLAPIRLELSPFVSSFQPIYTQPWFLAANGVPLALLMIGWLLARRRERLEKDPDFARQCESNRAVQAELDRMRTAVGADDSVAFFTAARRAYQHRFAERWKVRPDAVTLDLLEARRPELVEAIRPVFDLADEVAYAGNVTTQVSLSEWAVSVKRQLAVLKKDL